MSNAIKPSFSIECEKSVLGAILTDENALNNIKHKLSSSDFYLAKHGLIYNEMLKKSSDGEPFDTALLFSSIEEAGLSNEIGGIGYLGDLMMAVEQPGYAESYAKRILELSKKRKIDALFIELTESMSGSVNQTEAIAEFNESVSKIESNSNNDGLFSEIVFDCESALDMDEPDFWIDGYLPKDSFSMVFGPSGQFKSFIAMDIACTIASGISYHGNEVEAAPVIYMTGEGQRSIKLRKLAWQVKNKVVAKNMGILPRAIDMTSSSASFHLSEAVKDFEKTKGIKPKLLVIDTLNRSFGDGDENSTQDMTKFVKSCDEFRATTGCDILIIHHSGKDVLKGARGSSVLKAALDNEFSVERVGEDLRGRNVTLSCSKCKDGQEPPDMTFYMKTVPLGKKDKKGRELDSLVPELTESPTEKYVDTGKQAFIDIVKKLDNKATMSAVLKEFKNNMPIGVDQSQAAAVLSSIASNCGAYVNGGRYHLPD